MYIGVLLAITVVVPKLQGVEEVQGLLGLLGFLGLLGCWVVGLLGCWAVADTIVGPSTLNSRLLEPGFLGLASGPSPPAAVSSSCVPPKPPSRQALNVHPLPQTQAPNLLSPQSRNPLRAGADHHVRAQGLAVRL